MLSTSVTVLTSLLTFWQQLQPSSERPFATRCRHGEQLITDMRKLAGPISVHQFVLFSDVFLHDPQVKKRQNVLTRDVITTQPSGRSSFHLLKQLHPLASTGMAH